LTPNVDTQSATRRDQAMLRAVFLRNTERRAPGWRRPRVVARPQRTQAAASPVPACPAPRCSSTDSFPHERGSASQPRSGDRSWGQLRGVSGPREALQGRGGNKAQQPMNTAIPDRKHASPLIPAPIPSLHGKEGVDGFESVRGLYSIPRCRCCSRAGATASAGAFRVATTSASLCFVRSRTVSRSHASRSAGRWCSIS
jgi:hypothetical protein